MYGDEGNTIEKLVELDEDEGEVRDCLVARRFRSAGKSMQGNETCTGTPFEGDMSMRAVADSQRRTGMRLIDG